MDTNGRELKTKNLPFLVNLCPFVVSVPSHLSAFICGCFLVFSGHLRASIKELVDVRGKNLLIL